MREGARRMLLTALRAEVDEYLAQHADERDELGHALVVRNGIAEPRKVTTAAGELEIQTPRVHDRRDGHRFTSAILPPWARRSPKVTEVLPVLYLRGISTKDFEPALAEFFGSEAGLSASTIQRLTREWTQELAAFRQRDLSHVDYVYLWADGVHFNIRLEEDRLCCLVLIGVRADGHKELVAIGDGFRESIESWSELLRDLKRRGMRAPVVAPPGMMVLTLSGSKGDAITFFADPALPGRFGLPEPSSHCNRRRGLSGRGGRQRRSPRWPRTAALRREAPPSSSPCRRRRNAGPPRHNTSGGQQWTSPYPSRQVRGGCHYL